MVEHLFLIFLLVKSAYQLFILKEEIELKKNQFVAILSKLPKEYELSFELKPTTFLTGYANVIHLSLNGDSANYGDRTPGVWVTNEETLHISSAINGVANNFFSTTTKIALMVWTYVKISQLLNNGIYSFTVQVDKAKVYELENKRAMEFTSVKVYFGDPWWPAQPGYIRNFSITNAIENSFSMIDEVELKQNQLQKVFNTLPKEYELAFEVKPTSYRFQWSNIIHLTIGGNSETYGDRTPGVWVHPNSQLQFFSAINGNPSETYYSSIIMKLMEWTKIKIAQLQIDGASVFTICVNEVIIHTMQNNDAREFKDVKVFIGDPWYLVQPGYIRNIVMKNVFVDESEDEKPLILVTIKGLVIGSNILSLTSLIASKQQIGLTAFNLTLEYSLPLFATIHSFSISDGLVHFGSMFTFSGTSPNNRFNHSINITIVTSACPIENQFFLEIPLKVSFQNLKGKKWNQYETFRTKIACRNVTKTKLIKDFTALPESYPRGLYWDDIESSIYVCMNQYVSSTKTACYYSYSDGKLWSDMDMRVGSVLGHHFSTRVLYAVHRNQKSYLMYHNAYKKWLVITNDEFVKNISDKINLNGCKNLDESYLAVYRFGQNQWMRMHKYDFGLL